MKSFFYFLLFTFLHISLYSDDFSDLLKGYTQEKDLSNETRQENIGHVTILTRQDIERLQLKTLKDLTNYIPFMSYKQDEYGYGTIYHIPYQKVFSSMLRLYLDDRELYLPYSGSGLKIFSNISLSFIDHIEIYTGIPSYAFGIETSIHTVKLYTKEPSRENVTVAGIGITNKGSKNGYVYSAYQIDDLKYFISAFGDSLKQEKSYNKNYKLSRDKENISIFSKINKNNHEFQFHAMKGKYDNFIGSSIQMEPKKNYTNLDYLYAGWKYMPEEKDYKISLNYIQGNSKHKEEVNDILKVFYEPSYPNIPFATANGNYLKTKEHLVDFHIAKTWNFDSLSFILGYRGRYKHFDISDMYNFNYTQSNNYSNDIHRTNYNSEYTSSLYAELIKNISLRDTIFLSLKDDKIYRNGNAKNDNLLTSRLGISHYSGNWFAKIDGVYSETPNDFHNFYYSANVSNIIQNTKNDKIKGATIEVGAKADNFNTSFLISKVIFKKQGFYNTAFNYYSNSATDVKTINYLLTYLYNFNEANRLEGNLWYSKINWQNSIRPFNEKYMGGYLSFLNTYKKFDIANTVYFKAKDFQNSPGYDYNIALVYHYNRNLSFAIRGINLFNKGLKSSYDSITTIASQLGIDTQPYNNKATINKIPIFDRAFWLSLEYQF